MSPSVAIAHHYSGRGSNSLHSRLVMVMLLASPLGHWPWGFCHAIIQFMRALAYKPKAYWRLDDPAPFNDYSGYNRTGTLTGTESHGISLGNNAVYSQRFHRDAIATLPSPIYQTGYESNAFSVSALVEPIDYANGADRTAQGYRENLMINPRAINTGVTGQFGARWGWTNSYATGGVSS